MTRLSWRAELARCSAVVVERDSSEFARLSQLGDILGLSPLEINSVHSGLAEQAYRSQVQQAGPTIRPLCLSHRMSHCCFQGPLKLAESSICCAQITAEQWASQCIFLS